MIGVGGCTATPRSDAAPANQGDCTGRIRFEGVIYRPHNAVNQEAPAGLMVGTADVIGCGGLDAPAVDIVEVHSVRGVGIAIALVSTDADWHGVYVAEDLRRSAWPDILKSRPSPSAAGPANHHPHAPA
jgi:hypothetical protein